MTTETNTKLYIAYGANVDVEIFKQRCPSAKLLGTVTMRDYLLIFRGVADLVRAKGCTADCAVWELTAEDEALLDQFESLGTRYTKRLIDLNVGGQRRTAFMYVMTKRLKDKGQQVPYTTYEACLRKGYAAIGIREERINTAILRAKKWCEENDIDITEDRFLSRVWQPVQGEVVLVS